MLRCHKQTRRARAGLSSQVSVSLVSKQCHVELAITTLNNAHGDGDRNLWIRSDHLNRISSDRPATSGTNTWSIHTTHSGQQIYNLYASFLDLTEQSGLWSLS